MRYPAGLDVAMKHRWPALLLLTPDGPDAGVLNRMTKLRQAGGVVLRSYSLEPETRLALGCRLAQLCRVRRLLWLVAVRDSVDLALAARVHADGLHLPEGVARRQVLASALGWRRRHRRLLTVAAHGPRGLARGGRLGANAALLSPVFPTTSHPDAIPIGAVRFAAWCCKALLPVVALGGMRLSTQRRLRHARAIGIATHI